MTLESLGVDAAEQRVYEALLVRSEVTLAQLAGLAGMPETRVRPLVKSLADKGMLTRNTGRPVRFTASPPDIALELLALRRRAEIERARLAGVALGARFSPGDDPVVRLVRDPAAVAHQFQQVQAVAKTELLTLHKPPELVEDGETRVAAQARGVRCRTIHEQSSQPSTAAGQTRTMVRLPAKLVIADARLGLVFAEPPTDHHAVLVSSQVVLAGLVALFELLWERATPLWPEAPPAGIAAEDRQLLALLAAGLTDQAIGRKLGVAQRTVERRVRRVMDSLGARTRFQAGRQAADRGLLGP
ncbi:TrmB family transcriptional regulator [Amycolatopsis sp. H20-H5]|uniref:TrmB family transcriptional regulator n=1 Tax=Amycolatopsis sp. H20-H5 TaxID=3046309 RepID=UPI002DBCB166|nr:helix-turn-helix domain-containing protein [Amycolatopsis sp. H20-H5]MEC3982753.1 helix-turn-helix domain-containing protein [Amycolatopsis sp. H20-H5]